MCHLFKGRDACLLLSATCRQADIVGEVRTEGGAVRLWWMWPRGLLQLWLELDGPGCGLSKGEPAEEGHTAVPKSLWLEVFLCTSLVCSYCLFNVMNWFYGMLPLFLQDSWKHIAFSLLLFHWGIHSWVIWAFKKIKSLIIILADDLYFPRLENMKPICLAWLQIWIIYKRETHIREWSASKSTKNTMSVMTADSSGTLANRPSCTWMCSLHMFSALQEYFSNVFFIQVERKV